MRHFLLRLSKVRVLFYLIKTLMSVKDVLLNLKSNFEFRNSYLGKDFIYPPLYFMYETFGSNYQSYFQSSKDVSRFVLDTALRHSLRPINSILDLGSGVGRITHQLAQSVDGGVNVWGCDINLQMINWSQKKLSNNNLKFIHQKSTIALPFEALSFDVVYVISIVTHTSNHDLPRFLREMSRVLRHEGILIFTTQGDAFNVRLLPNELDDYINNGNYVRNIGPAGDRFYSSYHSFAYITSLINESFRVLEFTPGSINGSKINQDIYVLQKK